MRRKKVADLLRARGASGSTKAVDVSALFDAVNPMFPAVVVLPVVDVVTAKVGVIEELLIVLDAAAGLAN